MEVQVVRISAWTDCASIFILSFSLSLSLSLPSVFAAAVDSSTLVEDEAGDLFMSFQFQLPPPLDEEKERTVTIDICGGDDDCDDDDDRMFRGGIK